MILSMLSKLRGGRAGLLRGGLVLVVILVWLALGGMGGQSVGKLSEVQENDAASFLPQSAESTRAAELDKGLARLLGEDAELRGRLEDQYRQAHHLYYSDHVIHLLTSHPIRDILQNDRPFPKSREPSRTAGCSSEIQFPPLQGLHP